MKSLLIICLTLVIVLWTAGAQSSKTATSQADVKKYIRSQVDGFADILKNKDIDKMMSIYWHSPHLVSFEVTQNITGYDNFHAQWEKYFADIDFTKYTIDKWDVTVHDNWAVESGQYTVSKRLRSQASNDITPRGGNKQTANEGMMGQGTVTNLKGRFLRVWELKDGKWVITATHSSYPVPFQVQNQLTGQTEDMNK